MGDFDHLDLVKSGKLFYKSNLQLQFQEWCDGVAHPEMERRVHETGFVLDVEASDDDDIFKYEIQDGKGHSKKNRSINEWSLQDAIAKIFNKFLDKTETQNYWQCGLDLNLGTWKEKLFSKDQYNQQTEQQQRLNMLEYAVHDCTALPELYFHMYPGKINYYQGTTTTAAVTTGISISTPALTTTAQSMEIINNCVIRLADAERELIEALKPEFNQPPPESTTTTTTTTTSEKSVEQKKKERQRIKNERFKLKKKYDPKFQNKITRPIYHLYDYKKIRAQLADDNIFPTHQTTISRDGTEVMIVFRSKEEAEHAKTTVRINYFSRNQYMERWSGT